MSLHWRRTCVETAETFDFGEEDRSLINQYIYFGAQLLESVRLFGGVWSPGLFQKRHDVNPAVGLAHGKANVPVMCCSLLLLSSSIGLWTERHTFDVVRRFRDQLLNLGDIRGADAVTDVIQGLITMKEEEE